MDIKDIKQARYCPLHLPTRDHQSRMICFPIKKVEYFLNSSAHWREKRNIECPKYSCPSHTVVEARGISMALSASLHNMLIDSRKNWRRGGGRQLNNNPRQLCHREMCCPRSHNSESVEYRVQVRKTSTCVKRSKMNTKLQSVPDKQPSSLVHVAPSNYVTDLQITAS